MNIQTPKIKKVFVAMSGGVDSSVAAALLKDEGYEVIGVTMCFSINYPSSKRPSCCGAEGIKDAKRAAQILEIPHYVLDFAKDINEYVIENFVEEYINARTPNPCVRCNQFLKFDILFNKALSMGADYFATGHYAKISRGASDNSLCLKKAKDKEKDQSYFLYSINKKNLPKLLFPLGDLTKEQVREIARGLKLNTAEKVESQDICFVPESGYKEFIRNYAGDKGFKEGDFVDENGKVVGRHSGLINYTIGQRDKLGISLGHPVYVYKIDKKKNIVCVGPKERLYAKGLYASRFNSLALDTSIKTMEVEARIRYNSAEVKSTLEFLDDDMVKVEFKNPQLSVTPGQSVVFYKDDLLLGGAIIEEAII